MIVCVYGMYRGCVDCYLVCLVGFVDISVIVGYLVFWCEVEWLCVEWREKVVFVFEWV